ncbi:MAG TPA: hypothetical protein VK324_11380 [Tepidisphaeraceae bacterium]|nr:hypothetical protein [Tepidisphaeraceae bacterium]
MAVTSASSSVPSASRGQFDSTVVENAPLCREHFRLTLRLDRFPPTRPGQFVQIACRDFSFDDPGEREVEWVEGRPPRLDGTELSDPTSLLRRPFSLAGRRDLSGGGVELDVIHRVVGLATGWLAALRPGDLVNVLGPLGNAFAPPPEGGIGLLVGGGVGIPPMIYLAEMLARRRSGHDNPRAVAFCGAVTRDLLALTVTNDAPPPKADKVDGAYNIAEFARHGIPAVISTDDGSYGYRGFVTQALEQYLDLYLTDNADRGRAVVYTCGPEPMMKRVAEIAARRQVACQVAVERAMACGMGTCQSCVIRLRKGDAGTQKSVVGGQKAEPEWAYRLACTDGPVFRGEDLLW